MADGTRLVSETGRPARVFESHQELGNTDKPSRGVAVFTNCLSLRVAKNKLYARDSVGLLSSPKTHIENVV